MKILITKPESVAIFFGFDHAEYRDNITIFSNGVVSSEFNETNSMIIDVEPPATNLLPRIWKYENGSWTIINQESYDFYESMKVPEETPPE